jgi:hypothetical protein
VRESSARVLVPVCVRVFAVFMCLTTTNGRSTWYSIPAVPLAACCRDLQVYINGLTDKGGVSMEFSVQILTTGFWPTYKQTEVVLHPEFSRCQAVFRDYYDTKTSHRRLTWIHSLGQATVRVAAASRSVVVVVVVAVGCAFVTATVAAVAMPQVKGNYARAYDLQVTTLQALTLLVFNARSHEVQPACLSVLVWV